MILNLHVNYADDDLIADIASKNKLNIIDIYSILSKTATQEDLDKVNKLIGDYQTNDPNGALNANETIITNLVTVKQNLTSALARIKANEERLTKVETAISDIKPISDDNVKRLDVIEPIVTQHTADIKINKEKSEDNATRLGTVEQTQSVHTNEIRKLQTDGIGNYLGTYKGNNADDISKLPATANTNERAILEFLVGDEVKYQEYKWIGKWDKIGNVLDSHIHSQSAGISLKDVENQQDPKIKKATDNLIAFYKGQILEFNEEKTGTKFEDGSLFDKHIIADGQAIVGGTDGSSTNGEVISHKHIGGINADTKTFMYDGISTGIVKNNGPETISYGNTSNGAYTSNTGGAQNKAYGIKLLKVVYIAKKDIKESEMK